MRHRARPHSWLYELAARWAASGDQSQKGATFETLCSTTTNEFYSEDRGTNYSQARYLCYYLQELGLLQKYYQQFAAMAEDDPTAYATLQSVLGEKGMAAFQKMGSVCA